MKDASVPVLTFSSALPQSLQCTLHPIYSPVVVQRRTTGQVYSFQNTVSSFNMFPDLQNTTKPQIASIISKTWELNLRSLYQIAGFSGFTRSIGHGPSHHLNVSSPPSCTIHLPAQVYKAEKPAFALSCDIPFTNQA